MLHVERDGLSNRLASHDLQEHGSRVQRCAVDCPNPIASSEPGALGSRARPRALDHNALARAALLGIDAQIGNLDLTAV
jgi:hypothetical protein